MVSAGFGLVLAAVDRPVHGRVHEVFGLVAEVVQASDLGQGQVDSASTRRGRGWRGVVDAGGGGWFGRLAGCVSPFFARCRRARMARKVCASMAKVMCRYQAW